MRTPLARASLLWKILLSTSAAITVVFAVTGWMVVRSATRATSESITHEAQASFQAYQSLWKARADRLSSISSILSAMSDVRAAFGTGDHATIRDTAAELWSRVSDEEAIFLVATPLGQVIASLGGVTREALPRDLPEVREALPRFPSQVSGFLARGDRLYHLTITPVYVQTTTGTAPINVLVAGYEIDRSLAESLKRATGGSEFVFLGEGRVIAATVPPRAAELIASQLSTSDRPIHAGKSKYAPFVTPLQDIQGRRVGRLAILRSFDTADREIRGLQLNISLLWLASVAAGLALAYVPARRIVEPVKALDRAATEVARQNFDCEVPVQSEDELGRLASTFNAMCASIRKAREDLIHSERISTIGRLATSIVHDLRNPLAAVYGGAEMLMYGQLSTEQTERLARNMYQASTRIQELLQDLLDIGRGKVNEIRPHNLHDLVVDVAASFETLAEVQFVKMELSIPEDLEVPLDQHRIERVFMNLLGNAIEAMPNGGSLTVSARKQDGSVIINVRDTGPGIAPEIQGRLFQPFVTAGKGAGLGLGLALARQTVVDHGGDMWVDTTVGQGACFSFRLPLPPANN